MTFLIGDIQRTQGCELLKVNLTNNKIPLQ